MLFMPPRFASSMTEIARTDWGGSSRLGLGWLQPVEGPQATRRMIASASPVALTEWDCGIGAWQSLVRDSYA